MNNYIYPIIFGVVVVSIPILVGVFHGTYPGSDNFSTPEYTGESEGICHVLALSGGGNRGAYEAGVVWQLVKMLEPSSVTWDVVSGVSAGSINTARISTFEVGDEAAMAKELRNFWATLHEDDIWSYWNGEIVEGTLYGILEESGALNDTQFKVTMGKIFEDSAPQKMMVVSSVDSKNGQYHHYTENVAFSDLPTVVTASGSVPATFETQHYDDKVLIDGGTVYNTNFVTAIERCLGEVAQPYDVVVDIAICQHAELHEEHDIGDTISNWLRYHHIKQYYKTLDDILEFSEDYPEVNFRYLFVPSKKMKGGVAMLDFGHEATKDHFRLGIKDAKSVVGMGEGAVFQKLLDFKYKPSVSEQYEHFKDYVYE